MHAPACDSQVGEVVLFRWVTWLQEYVQNLDDELTQTSAPVQVSVCLHSGVDCQLQAPVVVVVDHDLEDEASALTSEFAPEVHDHSMLNDALDVGFSFFFVIQFDQDIEIFHAAPFTDRKSTFQVPNVHTGP